MDFNITEDMHHTAILGEGLKSIIPSGDKPTGDTVRLAAATGYEIGVAHDEFKNRLAFGQAASSPNSSPAITEPSDAPALAASGMNYRSLSV